MVTRCKFQMWPYIPGIEPLENMPVSEVKSPADFAKTVPANLTAFAHCIQGARDKSGLILEHDSCI